MYLIIGVVLAIAVAIVVIKLRRRFRRARYEAESKRAVISQQETDVAELVELLDRADKQDQEAVDILLSSQYDKWRKIAQQSDETIKQWHSQVISIWAIERDFTENAWKVKILADGLRAVENPHDRFWKSLELARALQKRSRERLEEDCGFQAAILMDQLQLLLEELAAWLLERASADAVAFRELHQLIIDVADGNKTHADGPLKYLKPKLKLHPPDEWNDLVARHYANPSLADFAPETEFAAGHLRLRAAAALKDGNIVEAKIVLAYCNLADYKGGKQYRREVGDNLAAGLAKLVTAHQPADKS